MLKNILKKSTVWLGGIAVLLLLGGLALSWGVDEYLSCQPPLVTDAQTTLASPLIAEADGTTSVGRCYRFTRKGIRACCLTGSPFARGAAMARLFPAEFQAVETSLVDTVSRFFPNRAVLWLLSRWALIRNRSLAGQIPGEIQAEVAGLAQASVDLYPQYGRHFTRLLNYLAAHDISHALVDDPSLAGCTAFGVVSQATEAHSPLLARNFDFEAGKPFEENKLVLLVVPETGHAFLSVAWPGMVGVVSGLNDAGLGLVLLAGHSQDRPKTGTPVSVVARQVLQNAATLAEAVELIRQSRVFVSESFLLGSGPEDAFVVVEKTPNRTAVRGQTDKLVYATNHFVTPGLAEDPVNLKFREAGTSDARWRRLQSLVQSASGKLDVPICVSILRDQRGPEGEFLGAGNRLAINSLVASHSVVFDLKQKIIWVSAGPHQLGEFVPFALEDFKLAPAVAGVPAVPWLAQGQYAEYLEYLTHVSQGSAKLASRDYQEALSSILEAQALNPADYHSYLLAGRALEAMGKVDESRYNYNEALVHHPAYLREREEIQRALARLEAEPK